MNWLQYVLNSDENYNYMPNRQRSLEVKVCLLDSVHAGNDNIF